MYTKAFLQLKEGDLEGSKQSSLNYWNGDIFEGVFEYRVESFTIVDIIY